MGGGEGKCGGRCGEMWRKCVPEVWGEVYGVCGKVSWGLGKGVGKCEEDVGGGEKRCDGRCGKVCWGVGEGVEKCGGGEGMRSTCVGCGGR